jgi:hypothetical protein
MASKRGAIKRPSPTKPSKARKAKVDPAVKAAADRIEQRAAKAKAPAPATKTKSRVRPGKAGATVRQVKPKKSAKATRKPVSGKKAQAGPVATTPAEQPRGRGRPTDYRPEMCDEVRAYGSEGMGAAEICAELGVKSRQTWLNWQEAHPEFLDAVNDARWLAQAWYEALGRRGIIMGKDFNALAWRIQVENRFSDSYRNVKVVHKTSSDSVAGLLDELDGTSGRFRQAA